MQNKTENIGDKINTFVQKNRKTIFIVLGLIVALFIGLIVYLAVSDSMNKKAIAELDEMVVRYEEIFPEDRNFYSIDDFTTEDVNALLADLESFAGKKKGVSSSKAWSLIGHIYSGREEWQKAEDAWLQSSKLGEKTYLGPLSLFNAATAAEEQGKLEQSIEYLRKATTHKFEFPAAARAQFNIGRLYEKLNKPQEALSAYREVLSNWPDMLVWQYFSRNRIIAIEAE